MQNSFDVPKPPVRPVSLQPFKTLKLVLLIVAIALSAFLVVYGLIYGVMIGALSDLFNDINSTGGEFFHIIGFSAYAMVLCFYGIFTIACWVLFFVFKRKYKERLEHNCRLELNN